MQANGIATPRVRLMPALETHLMLPWIIEVVLVAEASAHAQAKLGERDIRGSSRQLQRAEPSGPEHELEQMDALPAHHDLADTTQLTQR